MTSYEERLLHGYFPRDAEFEAAKNRLEEGEPLAYIVGEVGFYGLMFTVTHGVLIPRPDTEHVVMNSLEALKNKGSRELNLLDMCCGSGCIGISVVKNAPNIRCLSVDISSAALEVTATNSVRNGIQDRLKTERGDILDANFYAALAERNLSFDLITANPPYIQTEVIDTLSPEVRREPRLALDGGADGLRFYRAIIVHAPRLLKPDGELILEIGYDEGESVRKLCENQGLRCQIKKDYGKNDRVAVVGFR